MQTMVTLEWFWGGGGLSDKDSTQVALNTASVFIEGVCC